MTPHYCVDSHDGHRNVCICSTGVDHDEYGMDEPIDALPVVVDGPSIDTYTEEN